MLANETEYAVIGAGIIGLAIARELALAGKEVVVLEKNAQIGEETSFRNSAVLHAGIYYPATSLKNRFCREGQALLYDYCQTHQIPHQKIGKLIVITHAEQKKKLDALFKTAKENGVSTLIPVNQTELAQLEPAVEALQGLYSPETGIVDGRALLHSLKHEVEKAGGRVYCRMPLQKGDVRNKNITLSVGPDEKKLSCRFLINAAGLWAIDVAKLLQGVPSETIPKQYLAKGNYFKLKSHSPFSHLIYPLPESAGLGIHATLDLANEVRFGPDVEWVEQIDYGVSCVREKIFYDAIRQYYPQLKEGELEPAFAGIRPKIAPPDLQPQDFLIQDARIHGISNLIQLYGMESPGLTSSLAIARYVKQLVQ